MDEKYDIIVVGAGHAGSEAVAAAANLGSKTLLITSDMTKIAQMSCNPAMHLCSLGKKNCLLICKETGEIFIPATMPLPRVI